MDLGVGEENFDGRHLLAKATITNIEMAYKIKIDK